jgi:uncharacterized protein (TIRG00374 family)
VSGTVRTPWFRIAFSVALAAAGTAFLIRNFDLAAVGDSLRDANGPLIFTALAVIVITILAKTWRWQRLLEQARMATEFAPLLWALALGQYLNLLAPIRIGEIARIYALERQTGASKATTFSTLVVEKTLDAAMLVLSLAMILPFLVIPPDIARKGLPLAMATAIALIFLVFLAAQASRIAELFRRLAERLPPAVARRAVRLVTAGLEGISSLRTPRQILLLGFSSFGILILSFLTPLVLFRAFSLPLGLGEAILINLVLSAGSAPPSTPGKILVFEALVLFTLNQLGIDDPALGLSFALVYHLVVIVPQIFFGSVAALRGGFTLSWRPTETPVP